MKKPSNLVIGVAALATAVGVAVAGASLANAQTPTSTGYPAPQQGGYGQAPSGQPGDSQPPTGGQPPVGAQAPDPHQATHPGEKLLTGTTKDQVTAAARAKEPKAIIERVETDAEGVYEAHMLRPDGTHVTVHVGKDFAVNSVEVQGAGGPGRGMPPAGAGGNGSGGSGVGGTGTTSGTD
ncbi:hypothetical protein [Oryzihumus sp.]